MAGCLSGNDKGEESKLMTMDNKAYFPIEFQPRPKVPKQHPKQLKIKDQEEEEEKEAEDTFHHEDRGRGGLRLRL